MVTLGELKDGSEMNLHEVDIRRHSAICSPKLAVIATCIGIEGIANAITLGWHIPLSSIPPLFGIAIAPARYSHDLIEETGEFVINVMGEEYAEATAICGTVSGRSGDKFARADLTTSPSLTVRPPRITEALGVIECRVIDSLVTGDHTFFVGEVLWAGTRVADVVRERDQYARTTLLYFNHDQYGHGTFLEE